MTYQVLEGDCVSLMAGMPARSVDAVVCDPPYGLEFMGKEWDRLTWDARGRQPGDSENKGQTASPHRGADAPTFIGGARAQEWHQAWATEALRVLKPGGHLLAFGGTRTYHRLVCAVEDAGFEIRDTICWLYGSGFPKSLDVSKAIDRAAGAERTMRPNERWAERYPNGPGGNLSGDGRSEHYDQAKRITEPLLTSDPATPEAERWEGWGTALKPAWESVVVATKPDPAGERDTIDASLCLLGNRIASLSPANPAVSRSGSSPAEHDAALLASAQWTADERASTRDALSAQMDTSRFESAISLSLSTVSSWRSTLADLCELTSTFTTATASSTTTALETLKSSLSDLTPRTIIEDASRTGGFSFSALLAVRAFNGVESRLSATRELLAPAAATSASQGNSPAGDVKPNIEPVVVARKPLSGTVAATVLEHGTGALNVDGCRVDMNQEDRENWEAGRGAWADRDDRAAEGRKVADVYGTYGPTPRVEAPAGRWPANVVLSHMEECVPVGTRKVKGASGWSSSGSKAGENRAMSGPNYEREAKPDAFTDADGMETVEAYRCHPDCPVRLLDEQTGERPGFSGGGPRAGEEKFPGVYGDGMMGGENNYYGDSGGASRFMKTVPSDTLCALCNLPCVESVGNPSPQSTASSGTAPSDAPASPSQSSGDSSEPSLTSATPAELGSRTTPATARDGSAPTDVQQKLGEWIVQLAGSAEPLCKSCETSTAQSVALWLTDPTQASQAGQGSTLERRRLTLSRNLALIAAGSKQSGITPTTAVLSTSFGSADLATGSGTAAPATATNRFAYHPKSSRAERNAGLEGFEEREGIGQAFKTMPDQRMDRKQERRLRQNVHPTVKPISLMRWLVRLVTPPGGTVLDPFTGSGSTGCAAVLEGFDFIGLEREAEYVDIAQARVAWWHKHRGDGEAAEILAAGELRDSVEATGQLGMFD